MACAWENKRRAVEICGDGHVFEVGSYLYMGFEDPGPDSSLIEVKGDFSGYINHGPISDFGLAGDPLLTDPQFFSKNRRLFRVTADMSSPPRMYIERFDGPGVFSDVTPPGLRNSNYRMSMTPEQDALLVMNITNAPFGILQSSVDGENWTDITGETAVLDGGDYAEIATAVQFNGRLVAYTTTNKLAYSDDNGASWTILFAVEAGGGAYSTGSGTYSEFAISQGRLAFTSYSAGTYWSDDGLSWIVNATFETRYSAPYFAVNGSGTVAKLARNPFNNAQGFLAFLDNFDGGNHAVFFHNEPAFSPAGDLGRDVDYAFVFWDGMQFVIFARMFAFGAGNRWDVYTSQTGLFETWTRLPLSIPVFWGAAGFCKIID